ncbi:uncharacterized protein LOC144105754 [Amblyomma americanum]
MHALGECCCEQCTKDGSLECPLDRNANDEEDVILMNFSADDLLKRERAEKQRTSKYLSRCSSEEVHETVGSCGNERLVKCWNEGNECQYATAASVITHHFQQDREHHSVHCPRCSATVLCTDVCAHLPSASCNTSTSVASESQVP